MPSFDTIELLHALNNDVDVILRKTEALSNLDDKIMNTPPAPGKWSIAQVIEHLNSYNRYYLPEMHKALAAGKAGRVPFRPAYSAGIFGNYFTNMMLPKADGKLANKMNAPKDHRPPVQLDTKQVIAEFIAGQKQLLGYLKAAEKTDIGKLKVPISISKFIKLKLGDTFRFLIAHQQRHFIQLHNALAAIGAQPAAAATHS